MFYKEELVEEIRSRNDIVDVISGYVTLKKKGSSHWGCCPFHNEKTPSFSVSQSKQMYYCFGCKEKGNVYTFLMKYENYTFPEAIRVLADRAGIQLPEMEEYTQEQKARANRKQRLMELNKEAATYFYYELHNSPHGKQGLEYLQKRMLTDETMKKFALGYADKNGKNVIQYLKSKGFTDQEIMDSGIATHTEKYGLSCLFWNRVMYPILDMNKKVIGFGGRVMGEGEPKYLNSPETEIFDKRRNLYGFNYARYSRSKYLILCEGYMDVISMHQAGFGQAVASLGTAFTPEQARLIHRYFQLVYLAYDSDGAGVSAALRAIKLLRSEGIQAKVIDMRPHKDPDEFIKALGSEAYQDRIDHAENSFFYEIRMLLRDYNVKDPEERTKFHREIAKKLCEFEEEVERENYTQAIAEEYMINREALQNLVKSYAMKAGSIELAPKPRSGISAKEPAEEGGKKAQRMLITWISEKPELFDKVKKYISPEDFTEEVYRRVAEKLFENIEKGNFKPAEVISHFQNEEEQSMAADLFFATLPPMETRQDREKAFHDIIYAVKKNSVDYYNRLAQDSGNDMEAWQKKIERQKALRELAKMHISLD